MKKVFIAILLVFCFTIPTIQLNAVINPSAIFQVDDGGGGGGGGGTSKSLIYSSSTSSEIAPNQQNDRIGYQVIIEYSLYRYSSKAYSIPFKVIAVHEFGNPVVPENFIYQITTGNSVTYSTTNTLSTTIGTKITSKVSAKGSYYGIETNSEVATELSQSITASVSSTITNTEFHEESMTLNANSSNGNVVCFLFQYSSAYKYELQMKYKVYKYTREDGKDKKTDFENPVLVETIVENNTYFYSIDTLSAVRTTATKYFSTMQAFENYINSYYVV